VAPSCNDGQPYLDRGATVEGTRLQGAATGLHPIHDGKSIDLVEVDADDRQHQDRTVLTHVDRDVVIAVKQRLHAAEVRRRLHAFSVPAVSDDLVDREYVAALLP
jgi:hypothetical protein